MKSFNAKLWHMERIVEQPIDKVSRHTATGGGGGGAFCSQQIRQVFAHFLACGLRAAMLQSGDRTSLSKMLPKITLQTFVFISS
jgi:hypothetical protein